VLRLEALVDGILEAAVSVFYERTLRPKELVWEDWIQGQSQKVRQGLDALETEAPRFGPDVDLAQLCAGAAVGWLEFRSVLGDIRAGRPALFAWYDRFRERPSMRATEPHA
jgi:glutathione S-transferase